MSEDKNELNQASKKNDSSNEKKLDVTDGAKPKKLETEIKNEKKDTLSAESKKSKVIVLIKIQNFLMVKKH